MQVIPTHTRTAIPAPTRAPIALDDVHTDAALPLIPALAVALTVAVFISRISTVTLALPVFGVLVDWTRLSENCPLWLTDRLKLARGCASHVLATATPTSAPTPPFPDTLLTDDHRVTP